MAQKFTADLPPDFDLPSSYVVQLTAVDPTSGATVSGVKVSNIAIMASPVVPDTQDTEDTFAPTTPLWLPVPVDDQG